MPLMKTERALAKLNLTLDVVARRPDGYHDLRMVMQTVALWDTVTLAETDTGEMQVQTNVHYLPNGPKNLAAIAARHYFEAAALPFPGLDVRIQKQIPVCAGMGGGSSDGAAVLRALNDHFGALTPAQLERVAEQVGADVPYCIYGGTMLAEGKGERLRSLPSLPLCFLVICKPKFSVSTPVLFSRLCLDKIRCRPDTAGVLAALEARDLEGVARRMYNVFEDLQEPKHKATLDQIRAVLLDHGALGVSMSGTGPTMFGLFSAQEPAKEAYDVLKKEYADCFLTQPV